MSPLLQEMFQARAYKRSQGRIARQLTLVALVVAVASGCYALHHTLVGGGAESFFRFGLPLALFLAGAWFCYRLIHYPPFADFLISVEAEMNKVSWPTRSQLFKSVVVVLIMLVSLAVVLQLFDLVWILLLRLLGIVGAGGGGG